MKHISIPITKVDEPWCKVVLANGAVMVVRTVIASAAQIINDNGEPAIGPDGRVMINLATQTIVCMEKEPVDKKEMN